MQRLVVAIVLSLVCGIFLGWKSQVILSDGTEGIQWDFNDAASRGSIQEMKQLISEGADPLVEPIWAGGGGMAPLAAASYAGEPEAIEFLIALGANINKLESTETPLDLALSRLNQAKQSVELLKSHGAVSRPELKNLYRKVGNGQER